VAWATKPKLSHEDAEAMSERAAPFIFFTRAEELVGSEGGHTRHSSFRFIATARVET
jgi:hypothetical protein